MAGVDRPIRNPPFVVREVPLPYLIPAIQVAGVLHLLVASVNFVAAGKFRYRDNLARVSPIVRQVFVVQNVYIVIVLVGLALACFGFAADLAGASPLGRALSGFLALFWGLRLLLQVFFYDRSLKQQHRLLSTVFLVTYAYLCGVFFLVTLWGGADPRG